MLETTVWVLTIFSRISEVITLVFNKSWVWEQIISTGDDYVEATEHTWKT